MLDKLTTIFNSGGKIAALLMAVLVLVVPLIKLHCDNQDLEERNLKLNNDLAEKSKLENVLKDAQSGNVILSERNSFLEEDNIKLRVNFSAVQKRLKETGSKLLSYMESSSVLTIENERLTGILRGDSSNLGEMAADYHNETPYYSFSGTAYLYPETYFQIHKFSVFDSTYAGIRLEDDYFVGFIGHTNPLIKDNGASFSYALQEVMPEYSPWAWRAGVGPAWENGKLVPVGMAGVKYRQYGLVGFMAGSVKGMIISRDF